ncbi:MAG: DUF1257 domain-containing protein [Verrucomicrobia bacterium]|nr:DUF1257 domain-containing protein [Verrucomicrobiota bacterium]
MSHFTKVKTVIRDQAVLCEALRQLRHQFRAGENLVVRGYRGTQQTAQVVVNTGCEYDIGFQRQADRTFDAVADWDYGIRNQAASRFHQDNFLAEVHQKCAHLAVLETIKQKGWILEENRVLDTGEIEVVVCEPI